MEQWIRCNVLVVEDLEADPVGTWGRFLVPPRLGEHIFGFGTVVDITHYPIAEGEGHAPQVTVFVRRSRLDGAAK